MKSDREPAIIGSWIKYVPTPASSNPHLEERGLGYVRKVDAKSPMMLIYFPKVGYETWTFHGNLGQYVVINS